MYSMSNGIMIIFLVFITEEVTGEKTERKIKDVLAPETRRIKGGDSRDRYGL